MSEAASGPLAHLRVVDLTTEMGTLGVRFLSGLGASITRVVSPEGDALRRKPPFAAGPGGEQVSLYALHLLRGRREVCLDLSAAAGREAFRALLRTSDIVVESQQVGALHQLGVDAVDVAEELPHLIWTSITPFGREGPRAGWQANDLIGLASGGLMSLCGDPDRAPLRPSVEQGYALAGIQAAVGTLAALHARNVTGRGQLVDVSMQECVSNCLGNARLFYEFEGILTRRAGGARAYGDHGSRLVYPCADGYIAFSRLPASMAPLHAWLSEDGADPGFDPIEWATLPQSGPGTPGPEKARELEAALESVFARHHKDELYEEGQRRGLLICPVSTPADLVSNRQLAARGFFRSEHVPEVGREVLLPGPPVRLSAAPWSESRTEPAAPEEAAPSTVATRDVDSRDILAGVRIADFSWVGVGPLATQLMAWLGADVVRVESTARLDVFRGGGPKRGDDPDASAYFANCNRDKRGITLNLKQTRAREVALRLIAASDVVVESFTPGFMASVGLSYEEVRAVRPDVIMMSCSMEGADGPHAQFRGFGLTLQATVGFTHFTGWPDRPPTGTGVAYTDWFATGVAAAALLAALEHRRRTGEGQYIDLSQLEASTWALDARLLDFTVNGRAGAALGNRHAEMAPHGVYPCAGEDQWLAVAVRDDRDWQALRTLLTAAGHMLPDAPDLAARKAAEDAIDAAVAAWSRGLDKHAAAEALQAAGIPAAAVADVSDVQADVQLRHRGHFWRTAHPVIGEADWDGPAFRLHGTPLHAARPAPTLGQHNHEVYAGLLGYSEDELAALVTAGVLD